MKNYSGTVIQFSGYPLTIAETAKLKKKSHLKVVRPDINQGTTAIQKNKITNDPGNWDDNWFNGYE